MDRKDLYNLIASRKDKPKDYEPYAGDNGRVNKCVNLMRQGKIRTGGVLLDVGGGIGDLGYAVRDLFDSTVVLDICDKSNAAARAKGNTTLVVDVDKDGLRPLADESVDVVTALDFIEHIIDPENFARECFRVLVPGGEVFINTPNIRFWKHIEELWLRGTFPHTSGDREVFHGGHLAFYTKADLGLIFGSAGFKTFETFIDQEGFAEPSNSIISPLLSSATNQASYKALLTEIGSPNLLFKTKKL